MSITLPVLYIDGRATSLLQPLVAVKSKKTFYAKSNKSAKFGDPIPASILPNGLETVFSVGTVDNTGIKITVHSNDDGDGVLGQTEIEVNGVAMTAYVSLRRKTADRYNLVARVTNKIVPKVLSESDVFTVVG